MKPTVKIASLLLAVLMLFSVCAAGCSFQKEWSYKTDTQELAIGVYLTAMQEAYSEAQSYAQSVDGYDASSDKWLDLEITDSEGNKKVAKDWIKETAERRCLELLVMQPELDKLGATTDEATLAQLKENYETQWNSSGKAALEKHGVSMESFVYYESNYSRLRDQLFDALYGEGGTQAVPADEIQKYLADNYARYGVVPVSLYESTTDEAGTSTTVALSADKQKEITDALDGYVKTVNAEKDAKKAAETASKLITDYLTSTGKDDTQLQNVTLPKKDAGIADKDLTKALESLEEGKAVTVKTGEENSQSYFYIFRYDNENMKENYQADNVTDKQVLQKMKAADFKAYLQDLIDKSNYKKSDSVDKHQPAELFTKPSTDTSATTAQ